MKPRSLPLFPRQALLPLLLLFLSLSLSGCQWVGDYAQKRADKAAYSIIEEKQLAALDEPPLPFTIDPIADEATSRALASPILAMSDSASVSITTPSCLLSLSDTLAISFANNREYLARKETLYQDALALTETRRDFGAIFNLAGDAFYTRSKTGSELPEGATVEKFGGYSVASSIQKTLITGAVVTANFSHNFTKFFTNLPRKSSSSNVSLDIVQPLLNGVGPLMSHEPLTQAERSMIYGVRVFDRYQKDFAIQIIAEYFALLQSLSEVENQRVDYLNSVFSADRLGFSAAEGLRSELDADEMRQRVLTSRNAWFNKQADYLADLDDFKVNLGLPIDLDIGPDPREMLALAERGLIMPSIEFSEAVVIALENRLDLMNDIDEEEDRARKLLVALWNFLPNLDVGYSYSTSDQNNEDQFFPRFNDNDQTWSLDLGLPTDWTPRRNTYRSAQIALEQSKRARLEKRDNVIKEVRRSWRQLEYQRTNFKIQEESLKLAEKRYESAKLQDELMGNITPEDITKAQDDLLRSQNDLTAALVTYTIERLRFWHSIERLEIDTENMWFE